MTDPGTGEPENNGEQGDDNQQQSAEKSFTQADVDRMITERVSRAKATPPSDYAELKASAARLALIEDKNKTDLERAQAATAAAVATATAARTEYGTRLVKAQFDTLAARRNPGAKTDEILEYLDLSRLVDDNGEPDLKAIDAAVKRLVPEAIGGAPGLEGGPRKPAPASQSMNELLRQAAGR